MNHLRVLLCAVLLAGVGHAAEKPALELVPQLAHTGAVDAVAASANGRFIVSGGADRSVRLWTSDGRLVRVLTGATDEIKSLAISADAGTIVAGGSDRTLRVWSSVGKALASVVCDGRIENLALAPAADRVAVVLSDGSVRAYTIGGAPLWTAPQGGGAYPTVAAWAPSGRTLVVLLEDGTLRFLDTAGHAVRTLAHAAPPTGAYPGISFAADGRFVVGSKDGQVTHFAPDGRRLGAFKIDALSGTVAFLPDGKRFVAGALLWDTAGVLRATPRISVGLVRSAAVLASNVVVVGTENGVWRWDLDVNRLRVFGLRPDAAIAVHYDEPAQILYSVNEQSIRLWSDHGALLRSVPWYDGFDKILASAIARDGKRLAIGTSYGKVLVYDTEALRHGPNGRVLQRFNPLWNSTATPATSFAIAAAGSESVTALAFSPGGKELAIATGRGRLLVRDLAAAKDRELPMQKDRPMNALEWSSDGALLVGVALHGWRLWKRDGTLVRALEQSELWNSAARFRPGHGDFVVAHEGAFGGPYNCLDHFGSDGRDLPALAAGLPAFPTALGWTPDGQSLVAGYFDGGVELRDDRGAVVRALAGHRDSVGAIAVGSRLVASAARDGAIRLSRPDGSGSVALYAVADSLDDWIAVTSAGFFDASPRGARLLGLTRGLGSYDPTQLALRLDRADRVLVELGFGDDPAIPELQRLYERRLARSGVAADDHELAPPSVEGLEVRKSGGVATVRARLVAAGAPLQSYTVFVNGVPEPGHPRAVSGRRAVVDVRVPLGAGNNRIELMAHAADGLDSLRPLAEIENSPVASPALWFVGIGVSKYADAALALDYADKDAEALAALFERMRSAIPGGTHTLLLENDRATHSVVAAARDFLRPAAINDIVVLFIAGHGVHARDASATYYFLTHEARVADLAHSAVTFEELESVLAATPARQKLFLIDACQSGEVDPDPSDCKAPGVVVRGARGIGLSPEALTPAVRVSRDRLLFTDLRRRTGAIVISSSLGAEPSFEIPRLEHGVFTAALLDAFAAGGADADNDGRVTTDELRAWVTTRVPTLSSDRQHPTVDRDNTFQLFAFPR